MLFWEEKQKFKIFSIPIRIPTDKEPIKFYEKKENFKILSIPMRNRIDEEPMLI